jgi:hypothetical protein
MMLMNTPPSEGRAALTTPWTSQLSGPASLLRIYPRSNLSGSPGRPAAARTRSARRGRAPLSCSLGCGTGAGPIVMYTSLTRRLRRTGSLRWELVRFNLEHEPPQHAGRCRCISDAKRRIHAAYPFWRRLAMQNPRNESAGHLRPPRAPSLHR